MEFKFYNLAPLCIDIRKKKKSIEHFSFTYNGFIFDVIIDIDSIPFQMMVGIKDYNFAFVLNVNKGYRTTIPDSIYFELCNILNLNSSKDHFTFKFLKLIDSKIPSTCSDNLVNPDYLLKFRPYQSKDVDESTKTRFIGWNDHIKDGRKAHNFDKTERYLGKSVADYCREHNISSMWTTPDDSSPRHIDFPPGYK